MTFGLLGDLLLANALPVKQGFLTGMVAFALGHIAYIAAILSLTPHVQWIVEGVALLAGLAGWYLVVFRGAEATALRWAALPYALLVATTARRRRRPGDPGAHVSSPGNRRGALPRASDLLVAGERFGGRAFTTWATRSGSPTARRRCSSSTPSIARWWSRSHGSDHRASPIEYCHLLSSAKYRILLWRRVIDDYLLMFRISKGIIYGSPVYAPF